MDISGKDLKYGAVREEEKMKTTEIICGCNEGRYAEFGVTEEDCQGEMEADVVIFEVSIQFKIKLNWPQITNTLRKHTKHNRRLIKCNNKN